MYVLRVPYDSIGSPAGGGGAPARARACGWTAHALRSCVAIGIGDPVHEVPRTPMADVPPPAAHAKRPRAAAEMHGTADGGWDGDDGSVMSTRLWVGGAAGQTQR